MIGVALAIYFRRELLQFAVIVVVLIGLTFIWRLETQVTGLEVGLSLALLVATVAVIRKLKLDERGLSAGSSKKRSARAPFHDGASQAERLRLCAATDRGILDA